MKLKKLLSVFVSLALLLSLISVPVFADGNNVAQIGDTEYATLADAVSAAQAGDTIKMIDNATVTSAVTLSKSLELDLNGHTVTTTSVLFNIYNSAVELTIKDSVGSGAIDANAAKIVYVSSGKFILESGALSVHSTSSHTYGVDVGSSGSFEMNGGSITIPASSSSNYNYCVNNSGISVINGGVLTAEASGGNYAVSSSSGTLTLAGGSITAKAYAAGFKSPYALYITGGTAFVSGGYVKAIGDSATYSAGYLIDGSGTVSVTGGYFGGSYYYGIGSNYVADNYKVVTLTDNEANATDAAAKAAGYKFKVKIEYVAQIGDVKYESFDEAIAAAQSGDTITLLNDVTVNTGSSSSSRFAISKSMTIDGNGHTISINNRGFGVGMSATSDIDVTFKNITITNSTNGGRCVDTRGHINSLTLDNVVLATTGTSGYLQPLTIGGNQATVAEINVINSTIKTSDDGSKSYAIITFNPVDMTITDSTIKGWACVYAKGPDGSAGSAGSTFTVTDSTLVSKNIYSGKTNAFSMFMFEDDDVTVNVTDSILNVSSTGDQYQSIGSIQDNSGLTDVEVNLGEGNVVTMTGEMTAFATNYPCVNITGGTYNVDPTYFVAEDYVAIDNNNGTWTVSPIAYVAQVGATKYATLEEALAAAPAGATVELLADIDYSTVYTERNARDYDREHAIDLKDCTLDMNGYTISTINASVVFGGNGATIENGTFNLVPKNTDGSYKDGSYALIIDNAALGYNADDAVTVNDVVCNGGVNVCAATVELNNVTASTTPTKFYTVWAEENANVTVNSGVYTDTVNKGKGVFHTDGNALISVNGGTFTVGNKIKYGTNDGTVVLYGGTYNKVPTAFVASGYEAVDNGDGTWTVGEVKAGNLVEADEANDGYDATYTVKKQVVDANDTPIAEGTSRTVNVKVVDTIDSEADKAIASGDATPAEIIENLDMNKVLDSVVASVADSDDTIDVDVQVVRDKPALDESTNTITYEVHPEVIVTVNGVAAAPVVVSNDALDENASFTITLPVPAELKALAINGKIRVIHRSEGSEPEVLFHEVQGDAGNYYIQFNVSHFSEFELGSPLFTGHSISLEGYVDLNFFLNVTETQVTTGTGVVVDFTWARGSTSYQIKTTDFVEGKGYKATVKLPAAEMNYQINAKVTINGALQTETNSYSVREYCDEILDPNSAFSTGYIEANTSAKYERLVNLVKTMLDYGAKAQVAFGRTDVDLANADVDYTMPDASREDLIAAINTAISTANGRTADDMSAVATAIGANGYYSSSLIYLSGCTLRHYFVGPGLDASKYTGVKSGYYYYVDKANIAAADLDTLQAFQVGDETFYYSALDFAKAIIYNYAEGSNYDLAAATYWYNQAANAYFE